MSLNSILFCLFTVLLANFGISQNILEHKHIEVVMRSIGHQILLNSGDTNSRVLPIKTIGTQYQIGFENEVAIQPEVASFTIDSILQQNQIGSGYIVEIRNCSDSLVVHSYEQFSFSSPAAPACLGRDLPKACYFISISILNELDISNFNKINQSSKDENIEAPAIPKIAWISIPFLLFLGFVFLRKRNEAQATITEGENAVDLGKFKFNKNAARLFIENEEIELTGKEAALLSLLLENINTIMAKEDLLKDVWGNEDSYIGRTLDVTISKLRKKLSKDPSIKIENIRGVGYKLIL